MHVFKRWLNVPNPCFDLSISIFWYISASKFPSLRKLMFYTIYHLNLMHYYSSQKCNIAVNYYRKKHYTVWKVSVFGVFLVRIFPHSDWIRRDTERYGKTPNTDTFHAVSLSIFDRVSNTILFQFSQILFKSFSYLSLLHATNQNFKSKTEK